MKRHMNTVSEICSKSYKFRCAPTRGSVNPKFLLQMTQLSQRGNTECGMYCLYFIFSILISRIYLQYDWPTIVHILFLHCTPQNKCFYKSGIFVYPVD